MKITYQDLQHIKNEPSLIKFLKEKFNIPIPNELTLEDISSKYSNYALGLNEFNSKQVIDCQELSLTPGQPSGILILRFFSELSYSGVLHSISNAFQQQGKNLEDLRFICVSENYQPFAIAYLQEAKNQGSPNAELYILTWINEKTFINAKYKHEIPDIFTYKREEFQITSEGLLDKLEKIGTPLSDQCKIYKGITTGYNTAFVVSDEERKRLIADQQESEDILKLGIGKHQVRRWKPSYKNLIWVPSSKYKNWEWSSANSESRAENIFQETYPAISKFLSRYIDEIKNRAKVSRGVFYWELPFQEHLEKFRGPKITIYNKPPIMAFYDESDAIVINPYVHCIQTSDLSILAILNSSLFNWYLHTKFETKAGGCLNKSNLGIVPIATNYSQKELISDMVQQLLDTDTVDNQSITDLEDEIDMFVYKMYQLTDGEITYIKNSLNKLHKKKDTVTTKKLSDEPDSHLNENSDNQETREIIGNPTREIIGNPKNLNFTEVSKAKSISLENSVTSRQTHVNKLLAKIQKNGTPLINHAEMFGGPSIQPPLRKAFVLDELKRRQLINEDPKNDQLIIPVVYMPYNSKWKPQWKYLINISNSEFKLWPWSEANNETTAEKIFSENYPLISQHIFEYKNDLINKSGIGRFYWELSIKEITKEEYPRFYQPKIVYPADGLSLNAGYDTTESLLLSHWTCIIPTTDLALLGILNSSVFQWFALNRFQAEYKNKRNKNWLTFKKTNMRNYPIPDRTIEKKDIFEIVELIIDDPKNSLVPEFEEEINQLVYKLYDLTPQEIELIEEESSK